MFTNSKDFWEKRYTIGDNSGNGSYGLLAEFKAKIINEIIRDNNIETVGEFGCGDGNQLSMLVLDKYTGYDVSNNILHKCNTKFSNDKTKKFLNISDYSNDKFELSMSLDVIYHLVEDEVFENHMKMIFSSSNKHVIIYSSDFNEKGTYHVKHRKFTLWIEKNIKDFKLINFIKNEYPKKSSADFFIYKKISKI